MTHDGSADEQALVGLFASLVADAPASDVSPAVVVRLGKIEAHRALDARIKRFKVTRNVLVAAAAAALVVLIVPHLGSSSAAPTAASSSGNSGYVAAASAAAPQQRRSPAGSGAAGSSAAGSSAAGSGAAGSGAAGSGTAGSGTAGAVNGSAAAGAASSAAASGAMSSTPPPESGGSDLTRDSAQAPAAAGTSALSSAAPAAAPNSAPAGSAAELTAAATPAGCAPLAAKALAAFRSAFPSGYFGPAVVGAKSAPCDLFESRLPVVKRDVAVMVTVRRAAVGACRVTCLPEPGQSGVFFDASRNPFDLQAAHVFAAGYEVSVVTRGTGPKPIGPSFDQLVAGARAVIRALG